MIKGLNQYNEDIQKRILELYQMQVSAFGGTIKENELSEVFTRDGMICVRFINGDWYHYNLNNMTWY